MTGRESPFRLLWLRLTSFPILLFSLLPAERETVKEAENLSSLDVDWCLGLEFQNFLRGAHLKSDYPCALTMREAWMNLCGSFQSGNGCYWSLEKADRSGHQLSSYLAQRSKSISPNVTNSHQNRSWSAVACSLRVNT